MSVTSPFDDLIDSLSVGSDGGLGYTSTSPSKAYVDSHSSIESNIELDVNGATRVKGDFVLQDKNGDEINVGETLKTISERLCVLQPNFEAMEQYPALKDAYDQYKMLEKLLMDNAKKD